MPLVPNGRMRLMVAQTMSGKDPNNPGAGGAGGQAGATQPAARNNIQQEQVGAQGAPAEAGAEMAGDPSMEAPEGAGSQNLGIDVPSPDMMQGEEEQGQDMGTADSTLKKVWQKVMTDLGIEPRQIEAGGTELFSLELDMSTHTMSGFYKIPAHAKAGEIDLDKAKQIAHQIGGKFGLQQKLKMHRDNNGHTNWRVDFTSMQQKQEAQFGNSFDGIGKPGGGGGGGTANLQKGNSGQKQASSLNLPTMGEMLKSRRNMLYDTMRKIAKRSE